MMETVISRSLRVMFAGGMAVGMGMLAQPLMAQEKVQRVEVTGSSIKRLATESALPLSTMKAEDFAKQGLTTVQEVLNTLSMNQTTTTSSQTVGSGTGGQSTANLRGLGADKTLVLLNGRRLANHPYNADSIDLNIIPIAALERVEVLRDGASAIYGTDAIGGVINFITKRSVIGLSVSGEVVVGQKGGGEERRINVTGGRGDVDKDGYNFFAVLDWHKQDAMRATQRDYSNTGVRPEKGMPLLSGTSGTPFPANFFAPDAGPKGEDGRPVGLSGNPSWATGCLAPMSIPRPTGSKTCRFDFTQYVDNIPDTEQKSFLGKATFKINENNTGTIEYLHSESTNHASIAPPPLAGIGITMKPSSKFYPGKGITPAVAGLVGDLSISWRPLVTGKREGSDESTSDRFLAALDGEFSGWDYKAAVSFSQSKATSAFTGGYVKDQNIIDGVGAGLLNPFGDQDAAGAALLSAAALRGQYLDAVMKSNAIDFKVSKEVMQLPAGGMGVAFGGEFRTDKATFLVDRALAGQASSSGYADSKDQSGDRTIAAVFGEVNIPVIKDLEVAIAARYDRYNDVGGTFNPKIGFRFQPTKTLLLRGSYNTGFRAPTLFDLHGTQYVTNSANPWNDPVLCPGGKPISGVNPNIACDQQQNVRQGGNKKLTPEKSKTATLGLVLEPTNAFTASFDLWKIDLRDEIGSINEETIFENYAKYRSLFVYSADGKTLQYVDSTTQNKGEVHTRGLDIGLTWRLPKTSVGDFIATLDGTYVDSYKFQNEKNGPYVENVGKFVDAGPVHRWRHSATVQWKSGPWNVTLGQKYISSYTDQNGETVPTEYHQDVKAYSLWSVAATYTGIKNLSVTAGIKNLLDTDPPFSNQAFTFQRGYDPRFGDPMGRTFYLRGSYKFW